MIEVVEYKGKKILQITEEGMRYPFSFGLKKAKLILAHVEQIKEFVSVQENIQKEKEKTEEETA